jgi:hypothetical protein
MKAVKEAISVQDNPANFTNINLIPVEPEIACRPTSNLAFVNSTGIFTAVFVRANSIANVVTVTLKLNPKHAINPDGIVPGCNSDGVSVVAAKSQNVMGAATPTEYIRNGGKVTDVIIRFSRVNTLQPATVGIRVKYQENGGTGLQFNPKVKVSTASVAGL